MQPMPLWLGALDVVVAVADHDHVATVAVGSRPDAQFGSVRR